MPGSIRDYPILYVNAGKGGSGGGGVALGGNVLLATPQHKLDGAEHLAPDDTTRLDASTDLHGLLPKLSGADEDFLSGLGLWGLPTAAGVTYDNATSGLVADRVQAAIDEIVSGLGSRGPFFDIRDFGGVCDDTTDDTAALEAVRDAVDLFTGGTIFIPARTKITAAVTFTGRNYRILGSGTRYGPSAIRQATANTSALIFAPSTGLTNRQNTSMVENIQILGPATGGSPAASGRGIDATNDVFVENCLVSGFYDGIYVRNQSYYSYIAHTTVTNCSRSGIVGDNVNNLTIDTCRLLGAFPGVTAPFGPLAIGINLGNGGAFGLNIKIIHGSIEYFSQDGIFASGMHSGRISDVYFETQQSSAGYAHIQLGPSNSATALLIDANYFQGDGISGFAAIRGSATDRITVASNLFGFNAAINIEASGGGNANWLLINNYNSPAGTFNLPASSYVLDPGSPPLTNPMTTIGDLIKGGSSGAAQRLGIGSTGQILRVAAGAPAWSADDQVNGVTVSGTPSSGEALVATSSSAAHWASVASALDDLTDVVITSAAIADRLRFNGTNWVNSALIWAPVMVLDPGTGNYQVLTDTSGNPIMAEV